MAVEKHELGMTPAAKAAMDRIMARKWFRHQTDAAKFAMSVAIRLETSAGDAEGAGTSWNTGTFDTDGLVRSAVMALFPDSDTPYRRAEQLLNAGLLVLGRYLEGSPDITLAELFDLVAESAP